MLTVQGFYSIAPEGGAPIPIYIVSALPSRPSVSAASDWFCWREVLPPRITPRDGKKPERVSLELGDEICGYETSQAFTPISREEAFELAYERKQLSEEF